MRNVDAPSGAFHVSLPDKPLVRKVVTVAGSGEQLDVRMQQTSIVVSVYEESGPSQDRELVRPILEERARLKQSLWHPDDARDPKGLRVQNARAA